MQPKPTTGLLAAVVVLLAANLVMQNRRTEAGPPEPEGNSRGPCCLPDNSCVFVGDIECVGMGGTWSDQPGPNDNCSTVVCCASDIDRDGDVGILDFLKLLMEWGPCQ